MATKREKKFQFTVQINVPARTQTEAAKRLKAIFQDMENKTFEVDGVSYSLVTPPASPKVEASK